MIEYLEIAGYKSIKKLQLEMRPINVLIGGNGAGKSNFVSFFKLLDALYYQRLGWFVKNEKPDNMLYFGRKTTEQLEGKLIFSKEEGHNNAYRFTLVPDQYGGMFITEEGYGYNVTAEDDNQNYFTEGNLDESLLREKSGFRFDFINEYLSGIQVYHFHDTSATSKLRTESDINDYEQLTHDGRNLPSFLYYLQEEHPKLFGRIVKTIQSIAPYIREFILKPDLRNRNEIALRWVDEGDPDSTFGAYHFSDGTLRFIALAAVLMQPNPPAVIIIDEPELGLHPHAITKLAGLIQLASQHTQLIISTQSVNLVDCFDVEDIVTVDRDPAQNQSVFKRLHAEELNQWLEENSLGELWERNIIQSAQPYYR